MLLRNDGGTLVDVRSGELIENVNIVIEGDVIRSVGLEPVPDGIEVVDVTGRFVIPGLMDLHAHVIPQSPFVPQAKDPEETLAILLLPMLVIALPGLGLLMVSRVRYRHAVSVLFKRQGGFQNLVSLVFVALGLCLAPVPVLFDRETETIVSTESGDIIRMFGDAFAEFATRDTDFRPCRLRPAIDALNAFVLDQVDDKVTAHAGSEVEDNVLAAVADPLDDLAVKLQITAALSGFGIADMNMGDRSAGLRRFQNRIRDISWRDGHGRVFADGIAGSGHGTGDDDIVVHVRLP